MRHRCSRFAAFIGSIARAHAFCAIWMRGESPRRLLRDRRSWTLWCSTTSPFSADARSECFSHEIDALLEAGCEVLVTTTPAFGAIADAQRDCVIVGARDLLVDDCELSSSHVASVEGLRECDRVPAFLWGGQDGMREFLRGMRLGEMPLRNARSRIRDGSLASGLFR